MSRRPAVPIGRLACAGALGVVALSACARRLDIAGPEGAAAVAADTAFEAQPRIALSVDSASQRLVIEHRGASMLPSGTPTSFAVGRMFTRQLSRYAERTFRLESRSPVRVSVTIAQWNVKYGTRRGGSSSGTPLVDRADMSAVLTVTYARAGVRPTTRTYTYRASAGAGGGRSGHQRRVPAGSADPGAPRGPGSAREEVVTRATNGIVRQLVRDVIARTVALRRS